MLDGSAKEEIDIILRYATTFDQFLLSEPLCLMDVAATRDSETVSTINTLLTDDAPLPVLSWGLGSAEVCFPFDHPDDVLGSAWTSPILLRRRERNHGFNLLSDGNGSVVDDVVSVGDFPQRAVKRPRISPQPDGPSECGDRLELSSSVPELSLGMDVVDFDLDLEADKENIDPLIGSGTMEHAYNDLDADKENVDPSGAAGFVDPQANDHFFEIEGGDDDVVAPPQSQAAPRIDSPRAKALAAGLSLNTSSSLFLAPDLSLRSLALENFGRLRGRAFACNPNVTELRSSSPIFAPPEVETNMDVEDVTTKPQIQTTPSELIDPKTLVLPAEIALPNTVHRYLASLEIIQRHALVSCLHARECAVDLVERETLGGAHLVLDPFTAVLLVPVFVLPARSDDFVKALAEQTWKYEKLLILFEAYPEEEGRKVGLIAAGRAAQDGDGKMRPKRLRLHAYTPPVMKAIGRFRRGVEIAMACGSGRSTTTIRYAFANTVEEAAIFVRYHGNLVEETLKERPNDGNAMLGTWGEREWLIESNWDEEDEANLALAQGMNSFSACVVLCIMPLQDFVDLTPEERLDGFGPYLGADAMVSSHRAVAYGAH